MPPATPSFPDARAFLSREQIENLIHFKIIREVHHQQLGEKATPQPRLQLAAYLNAGLTEFWRAHRHFAGVLHFVYLTSRRPCSLDSSRGPWRLSTAF